MIQDPLFEFGRAGAAAGRGDRAAHRLHLHDRARALRRPYELPLDPAAEILPFAYTVRSARPRALPAPAPRRPRRRADPLGAPVPPHRRAQRHARAAGAHEPAHPREPHATRRATRKARRRRCETLDARQRQLPRLRAADDGSGAPPRRRDALRLRLPVRPRARRRRAEPGDSYRRRATPMPGCRPTCRAPAGSPSIRPTTCSAAAQLIRVGVARDPSQAAPISGSWFGDAEAYEGLEATVQVKRTAS